MSLCSLPEITNLRIECSLEGRPSGAAFDIGGEALLACHDVGVLQDSQRGRHHQITRGDTVTIKVRFVAERLGERGQALLHKFHRARAAQLRPFLICVKEIDQGKKYGSRPIVGTQIETSRAYYRVVMQRL
jgi:hypothetical protein